MSAEDVRRFKHKEHLILLGVLIVCAVVAVGFWLRRQQAVMADRQLASHAEQVARDVEYMLQRDTRLPADLAAVETDDAHKQGITYEVLDERRYRLCMTFQADRAGGGYQETEPAFLDIGAHGKGRQCYIVRPAPPTSDKPAVPATLAP